MILEDLAVIDFQSAAFRFEADIDLSKSLETFQLEPQDISAFVAQFSTPAFSASAMVRITERFLTAPKRNESRFTDGSFPVLYTALEIETAQAEVAYWFRKVNGIEFSAAAYYRKMRCNFDGAVVDLRPEAKANPYLVSIGDEGYSSCRSVSLAALERDIEGLLTYSARKPGGTCLPIFKGLHGIEWAILGLHRPETRMDTGVLGFR